MSQAVQYWDEEEKKNENGKGLKHEEWNDDIKKLTFPHIPERLLERMDQFTVGKYWIPANEQGDSYLPVMYCSKKCIIETPASVCFRGLSAYSNPDSVLRKYSTDFSLRTDGRTEMENFVLFLSKLDDFAKLHKLNDKDVFRPSYSVQRRDKCPTLRVKIPNYKRQFNIKLVLKETIKEKVEIKNPTLEEYSTYVSHDTPVKFHLLINNIWRAGGRYGLSFKLLEVKLANTEENMEFR